MKISVVLQPSNAEMGEIIKNLLSSQTPFYNNVWLISAFANAQVIQRITPNILDAKERGANINIVVGFDVKSTSAEALKRINSLGVNSVLVHNARAGHTFHPKIYLFEAAGEKAEVFVGSSNLTDGGLYTNYEASTSITFEFPVDDKEYDQFFSSIEIYLKPKGTTVQPLTQELIDILVKRGEVPTEKEIRKIQAKILKPKKKANIPKSPFGVEKIKRPPTLRKSLKRRSTSTTGTSTKIKPVQVSGIPDLGELLWQKPNLPASDVQRQSGNVTGGLRLTKAGWKVSGNPIDQTVYFRNDVFGHLVWSVWKERPYSEKAESNFDVYLLGKSYGIYQLMISHKPGGEAGQHNYTTILHWGDSAETIRQLNLVGKTFKLYAPPNGQAEPFIIEVT
ncbi:MAG: phospholipase D family protein [Anaerolineae bacterium]|nr:phospholipase D family protein [Anaerolineae bacterium]